jgi:putative membrane protein
MKKLVVLVGACSLLAAPALAQQSATSAAARAAPSTADFVRKVGTSDMFEIRSSQLAARKGDADSKPFARKMVRDHSKTSAELKRLINSGKVQATLPRSLDPKHRSKLSQLRGLSGTDFDRVYDRAQLEAHREAVALFSSYARSGGNSELRRWSRQTLPHLEQHLAMAKNLK